MYNSQFSPYLLTNPVWKDLAKAIDTVWGTGLLPQIKQLQNLTNPFYTGASPAEGASLPSGLNLIPAATELRRKLQDIGITYSQLGSLSTTTQWLFSLFSGTYWEKNGTPAVWDFLSFVLGTPLTITPLWTEDFIIFVPINGVSGFSPVTEGGTYYPTPYIELSYTPTVYLDTQLIQSLFEFFANINLVLWSIVVNISVTIPLNIVGVGQLEIYYE